jgi:hypothetical protein
LFTNASDGRCVSIPLPDSTPPEKRIIPPRCRFNLPRYGGVGSTTNSTQIPGRAAQQKGRWESEICLRLNQCLKLQPIIPDACLRTASSLWPVNCLWDRELTGSDAFNPVAIPSISRGYKQVVEPSRLCLFCTHSVVHHLFTSASKHTPNTLLNLRLQSQSWLPDLACAVTSRTSIQVVFTLNPRGRSTASALRTDISTAGEPAVTALCHCTDCQKWTGAAYTSNVVVPRTAFKVTKGHPKEWDVKGDSGKINKHFLYVNPKTPCFTMREPLHVPHHSFQMVGLRSSGPARASRASRHTVFMETT